MSFLDIAFDALKLDKTDSDTHREQKKRNINKNKNEKRCKITEQKK